MTNAPTPRETADHTELARLAEAATQGEWTLDGHQCLSAPDGTIVVDYSCSARGTWEADAAYLLAVQPSRVAALLNDAKDWRAEWEATSSARIQDREALLSEIAALRGEVERVQRECDEMALHGFQAVQAERQRDELRKAAEAFFAEHDRATNGLVAQGMPKACAADSPAQASLRQALANQGADQ